MDISVIQNNLGMWICAAFMIAIILIQAVLYLKLSRKEATTLGLPAEQQKEAMRSAAVTAVGHAGRPHGLDAHERRGLRAL